MSRRSLVALVGLGLSLAAPAASLAQGGGYEPVHGRWVNGDPCVITRYDVRSGDFSCTGSSVWTGTWRGVTEFTAVGKLDLISGDNSGRIYETFVGVSKDGRTGTMRWIESYAVEAGRIDISARIVDGTGDFGHTRGLVEFVGRVTPLGNGGGTYSGRWRT